jgi:carbamoyl-phosphate synthase large subunit
VSTLEIPRVRFRPYSLAPETIDEIREATHAMAQYLNVVGLMNVQFAVKKEDDGVHVYVLEVNPRASRTVPFVAKATGVPIAKIAAKVMAGSQAGRPGISDRTPTQPRLGQRKRVSISEVCRRRHRPGPRNAQHGRSHGNRQPNSRLRLRKANWPPAFDCPNPARYFISVAHRHKDRAVKVASILHEMGYEILSTSGTGRNGSKKPVSRFSSSRKSSRAIPT